jgi:hypothetical protein
VIGWPPGDMKVESEPGHTALSVYLPLTDSDD